MSDDEYNYQYDGFAGEFDSEDEAPDLAEQVDSLAEHTHWSPVLVNAHPDFELEWDEWEYLTDEYHDVEQKDASRKEDIPKTEASKSGKRKRGAEDHNDVPETLKRRKIIGIREKAAPSSVLWRKGSKDGDLEIPLIQPDEGKAVVLLPNWRELLPQEGEMVHQRPAEDLESEADDEDDEEHPKSIRSTTTSQSADRKPGRLKTGRQKENTSNVAGSGKSISDKPDLDLKKPSSKIRAKAR